MDGKGTLTITTKARDGWVDIEVCDTGCGIPPENLSKIMDPFFTTKPVGQGTGLGLSIVRRIVDEHGGKIVVDSKVGVGTAITISLPIDRGVNADAGEPDSDRVDDAEAA
jgi:signal transduction histidine kinase